MTQTSIHTAAGTILVVDARVDVRGVVRDVLKELGFTDIVSVDRIDSLTPYLKNQAQPPRWIICSLTLDDGTGAESLLKLRNDTPHLQKVPVTILPTNTESLGTVRAFSLGALSAHIKPFTANDLRQSFEDLFVRLGRHPDRPALVAASYVRPQLEQAKQYGALIGLEKKLVALYPDVADLHIKLAEAYFSSGDLDHARSELFAARFLGGNLTKCADQLLDLIGTEKADAKAAPPTLGEALGFSRALVVDSDSIAVSEVQKALTDLGVSDVRTAADGQAALDSMAGGWQPHLVIQEWRLAKVSGLALIQRLHADGHHNLPIVVLSSLPQKDDFAFLREVGVANVIAKPIDKQALVAQLLGCLKQERFPVDQKSILRRLRQLILSGERQAAADLMLRLESQGGSTDAVHAAQAEMAFVEGNLLKAKSLALQALQGKLDPLPILNLLGKVFAKLGDHEGAKKILQKAQTMSSKNIARLCQLAELSLMTGDLDGAAAAAATARQIDAASPLAVEASAKVAVTRGDVKQAKEMILQLDGVDGMAAYFNNKGVLLVQEGQINEAVTLYQSAIDALPAAEVKATNIVRYNLGLAYARLNSGKNAIAALAAMVPDPSSPLHAKASDLKRRLEAAERSGTPLKLSASDRPKAVASNSQEIAAPDLGVAAVRPGTMWLLGVFELEASREDSTRVA